MEDKYVFTAVAWAMYQLVPDDSKQAFWEAFDRYSWIDEHEPITHDMVQASAERAVPQCRVLDCPEYISLVQRCEDFINHNFIVRLPKQIHDFIGGSYVPVIEIECVKPPPTLLYFKGEPYQFTHDVELMWAVTNMVDRICDAESDRDSWKVKYARYLNQVLKPMNDEIVVDLDTKLLEMTGN